MLNPSTRVEAIVKRVSGLDVHKKLVVATVLLEQADGQLKEETREFGTLPEDLKTLAQWLSSFEVELTVMESTGIYWKNIYGVLEKNHLKAHVVNAWHIKKVPGRKTDVTDSQWLATLGRFGLLKGSFIPEAPLRELRLVTRYRTKLQRTIASEKNRLHKVLDTVGICLGNIVSDICGVSSQAIITGLIDGEAVDTILGKLKGVVRRKENQLRQILTQPLPDTHRFLLKQILDHIEYMEKERDLLDNQIANAMEPYKEYWQLLQTIPGVNICSAAALIAECGVDMERFGSMDEFCSWAGMCPGNNESAGKRKSGKRRKGNQAVRSLLCEIANAAIKTKSQFKDKYKTLVIRRGHKRSVVAIGHKILRVMCCVFTHKKYYKDPGINYEKLVVERNAPRWLRSLQKYAYVQPALPQVV